MAAIAAAVAAGSLTPSEAAELGQVIDSFVRALEVTELEAWITALEQRGAA